MFFDKKKNPKSFETFLSLTTPKLLPTTNPEDGLCKNGRIAKPLYSYISCKKQLSTFTQNTIKMKTALSEKFEMLNASSNFKFIHTSNIFDIFYSNVLCFQENSRKIWCRGAVAKSTYIYVSLS